jgi:hypothetical protein
MDDYKHIEAEFARKHGAVADKTRKSIGDFVLGGDENHPVNVKSNNVAKQNYSPNIISAWRLLDWLKADGHKLSFIFVDYEIVKETGAVRILKDTGLVPVENLSWACLSIQAQGKGVIQMSKAREIISSQDKKAFLNGLGAAYRVYVERERKKLIRIEKLLKELNI